jgi:hypothetical protein
VQLAEVPITGGGHHGVLRVATDYVGAPASAVSAQRLADSYGALLPTRKMVDAIWAAAPIKLVPEPIPGGTAQPAAQATALHQAMIDSQVAGRSGLVAGHKKDVVLSAKLVPGKVGIYGWHQPSGKPIQPLYLGHSSSYADYSQGVRLVAPTMTVDGVERPVADVMADPALAALVSDEGPLAPRYPGIPPVPQVYSLASASSTWVLGGLVALAVLVVGYSILR